MVLPGPHETEALRRTVTRALLTLADAEQIYETDASFHLHVDVLVAGLPGMLRGLIEQAQRDATRREAVHRLLRASNVTVDEAYVTVRSAELTGRPDPAPGPPR